MTLPRLLLCSFAIATLGCRSGADVPAETPPEAAEPAAPAAPAPDPAEAAAPATDVGARTASSTAARSPDAGDGEAPSRPRRSGSVRLQSTQGTPDAGTGAAPAAEAAPAPTNTYVSSRLQPPTAAVEPTSPRVIGPSGEGTGERPRRFEYRANITGDYNLQRDRMTVSGDNTNTGSHCMGQPAFVEGNNSTFELYGGCRSITVTGNNNTVIHEPDVPITDRGTGNTFRTR